MANMRDQQVRCSDFGNGAGRQSPACRARTAMLLRHRRKGYFGADLFVDPAWDMLLHLFVAYEEGTPVNMESCCVVGGAGEAPGVRWIEAMAERGLLTVSEPMESGARIVRMTERAHHAMRDFWLEQEEV